MRLLFFDQVLQFEPRVRMRAVKDVALSEEFFPAHFTRRAVAPGTLMTEAVAQVAGWLVMASLEFRQGAIVSIIQDVRFERDVRPGDQLVVDCEMLDLQRRCAWTTGRARVDGASVLSVGRMMFALVPNPIEDAAEAERARFAYRGGSQFVGGPVSHDG